MIAFSYLMTRAIIDLNHTSANRILKIAWAIEIIAAIVSFAIGYFLVFGNTGLSTEETFQKGGYISGLLFFLIGVIELSRIPLVISIYRSVKIWWKIVGTFFLIIVMFVTFESMLVGFEINLSFMNQKLFILKNKIKNNDNKIFNIESTIDEISTLNEEVIRENFKKDILFFENQRKEKLDENFDRIQSNEDKRTIRLDENIKKIAETNIRRDNVLKPYIEKRDDLREKTNSESQKLLRDKLNNKINQRNNLNSLMSDAKKEARDIYDEKIANKRINSSREENIKKENLSNVSKELSDEKKHLQIYISDELSKKNWGYKGRIKIRTKESNLRQDKLSKQISKLRNDISVLVSNSNKELSLYQNDFNEEIKTIEENFLNLEKNINNEIDLLNRDLEKRVLIDTESVKEELVNIEKVIENYNIQFDSNIEEINSDRKQTGSQFDKLITNLDERNNEINQEFEGNKNILEEERDSKINSLENQNIKIEELQNNKNEIKNINLELKDDYNVQVFGSIIHNFALKVPMWLYSSCGNLNDEGVLVPAESAADISSDCLDFTSTIWFGAMSLVVATTGTAVAFGSEVLRTSHPIKKRSNTGTNILRILRFVRRPRIKKIVETKTVKQIDTVVKEVIKEVEVQKVVPTEIIKEKTILKPVHIPFFTNDPALLNISHNDKTDKKEKKDKNK
jgi:hypothetical protein